STPTDTTAPDTTITSAPADGEATTATLEFSATEADSTFQCKIDAGSFATCTSPKTYTGLGVGAHTFTVRARATAGNTDATPATATWQITAPDTTPPSVQFTEKPSVVSPLLATSATFAFTGSDDRTVADDLTFSCALDAAPPADCTSPTTVDGLGL